MQDYPKIKIISKMDDDILEIPEDRLFKIYNVEDFIFVSNDHGKQAIFLRPRVAGGKEIEWKIGKIDGSLYLIPTKKDT